MATFYRIVEHHSTVIYAPFSYKGLVTVASTQCVQVCVVTQCVQLCDISWCTCERLCIAIFTRAYFHAPLRNQRRRNVASPQSRMAQSDRNGVLLEPSCAL